MTSMSGARDWTRTSTPAKALAPEASASTNFATRATEKWNSIFKNQFLQMLLPALFVINC